MKSSRIHTSVKLVAGLLLLGLLSQFGCQSNSTSLPSTLSPSAAPATTIAPQPSATPTPEATFTATLLLPTTTAISAASTTTSPPDTPAPTPTPATWQRLSSMLSAQSEMPALVLDGRIYIAGGATLDSTLESQRVFQVYDPEQDRWERLADLPFPTDHYGIAAYAGDIYVFSRKLDAGNPAVTAALRYEFATDSWQEVGLLPEVRHAGTAVTLGEYIYYVGGMTASSTNALLRYHPPTNTWTAMADLRRPREHNQAVVLDGEIYALGGRWDGGMTSVEIYDPEDNSWRPSQGMRFPRSGFGAAIIDGKIVVAGGELFSPQTLIFTLEVYDPETRRWEVAPFTLPTRMHGLALAAIGTKLYIIGGSTEIGGIRNTGALYSLVENWP